ncbi:WGR domain-containing protein [uncultured Tateyamaria sp.]|uniref:WGR domain-containing protein n=1 Tax=uncultured Tateyamaria sp. TaxID=455651 RepID=UPI0026261E48|nr:WGR domain-containing protein [uncultured Tateyamaria sp.]
MEVHLQHQIPEDNMDRFYSVSITKSLFGNPGVERRWGRVGTRGQMRLDWYDTMTAALDALAALVSSKQRTGYTSTNSTGSSSNSESD